MSKDCGLSEAAEKLNGAIDGAKDAVNDLIGDAVGGIADSVDGLLDKVTDLTDGIKGDLEAAVPEIPMPEAKLQDMMTKMMSTNDPGEMMTQFAEIKEKFGDTPGIDLDKMMSDFGLDPEKLNEGLDDFKDKLGKGNKLKEKLGGALDKIESVADSDLVKLASGDLSAIGKVVDGFAGFIMGNEDKAGLLEKICTKLANVEKEAPTDYVIQKGDTLTSIAKAHDTTVQALVELNDIKDPDKIFAGDTIKIPGKVVVKAVEGKAPSEDAKPEPEPEETKPKPKTDTKPKTEKTEKQRAQTYVQQEPEVEEVNQFNFGPLIRNDTEKSLAYQDDLEILQGHQEELNESVNEYLTLQHEFRLMAKEVMKRMNLDNYDASLDRDPAKYLAIRGEFEDKIIGSKFKRILDERLMESRHNYATKNNIKATKVLEENPDLYMGINWTYNNLDDIMYHAAYTEFIRLFILNMTIKYGKPGSAGQEIEFIIGEETYKQKSGKPGEKYFYPYDQFAAAFIDYRPANSAGREKKLIANLRNLSHILLQTQEEYEKEIFGD